MTKGSNYNILHIIDSLHRGGAETLVANTVEAIRSYHPGAKQVVVTLYGGGELIPVIESTAKIETLKLTKFNIPLVLYKLRKIINEHNINIVHSHLIHSTLISRLVLPKQVRLVSTYHSVFYEPTMVTYARKELFFDRFTYDSSFFTIYVSEAVKENISKAVGINKNDRVLVNFASPKFVPVYKFQQSNSLRIVMVGNLHEIKNHEIAIRAMKQLKEHPISIHIYGDGQLRPFLENLIKECDVDVVLKGKAEMTSEILAAYDLFLMTSHHEGMPLSLLEAMQTGLPSVLNDVPMLRETAGNSALYYDYDNLESLTEVLLDVVHNKYKLKNLSVNALINSKKYSAETYVNELFDIYNAVTNS